MPLQQFQQLQSAIDVSFWAELQRLKLKELRLSEEAVGLQGFCAAANHAEVGSPLKVDAASYSAAPAPKAGHYQVPGALHNLNTLERFKGFDRAAALGRAAAQVWGDICSGAAEGDPRLLGRFLALSFADLKAFRVHYWFAFPALKPPQPFQAEGPPQSLALAWGPEAAQAALAACAAHLSGSEASAAQPCCLLLNGASGSSLGQAPQGGAGAPQPQAVPLSQGSEVCGASWGRVTLAFLDPSNLEQHPGWPLRNLLLLAARRWRAQAVEVVCVRTRRGRPCPDASLLLRVQLGPQPAEWYTSTEAPEAVGWEAGPRGKPAPRTVDLGASLDPRRQAESAVELNLRLMRWRAAPDLDLDRIAGAKCLLLGAGTLGCAVARTLLGWGVRSLTLVDNARVSMSNPVRQSLFTFEDCLGGGRPKAEAAADALRRIYPSVEARGVQLTVPMPGHPLSEAEVPRAQADAEALWGLVQAHDVAFLLMDTREARWLPTLLAAAAGKLVLNAALGFDSFLVMRHGAGPPPAEAPGKAAEGPPRLGCYFCNDVVAPVDSTLDRTLDQQCTVARPGLAPIAGALAVELMAAALQHPLGASAPAPALASPEGRQAEDGPSTPLGPVPHMVRGTLGLGFEQRCLTGHAFGQCTACSPAVVGAFRARGWPFLLEALQDPKRLEDLTGLTELHASAEAIADMDFSEEEETETEAAAVAEEGGEAGPAADRDDF